jgi:hypothetical protein
LATIGSSNFMAILLAERELCTPSAASAEPSR